MCFFFFFFNRGNTFHLPSHLSLTVRVVGAPQMISRPVSCIFSCFPLPFGTWRTPGLSIPWCCLPTTSSVCLVFFPLSLCLARWFWPDLMSGRHDHTTAVCVSLQFSRGLRVVRLPAGFWHRLPRWQHFPFLTHVVFRPGLLRADSESSKGQGLLWSCFGGHREMNEIA